MRNDTLIMNNEIVDSRGLFQCTFSEFVRVPEKNLEKSVSITGLATDIRTGTYRTRRSANHYTAMFDSSI